MLHETRADAAAAKQAQEMRNFMGIQCRVPPPARGSGTLGLFGNGVEER
ncbi:hypothetical protein PR001_g3153 [Phytophthora rubi]|uniref:Uncharacterized protein n=1 Tax=Phytophthora rubi TaxID=129364 RepID=A0A6A3P2G2_9STRA|nr:hypothetical protein PR002_g3201 [Phytophthora rubi]KAE9049607.1 hypothetical protein PR001_g3153 [Phytophthora rubi]